jgi:hypothetical protein
MVLIVLLGYSGKSTFISPGIARISDFRKNNCTFSSIALEKGATSRNNGTLGVIKQQASY